MDTQSNHVTDSGFVLDGRAIGDLLTFFRSYCALIPFGTSKAGTWADFFFMNGFTPETLGALYADETTANGLLVPQQAFLLAFFRMLETPRSLLNRLPAMHRDLYYREFLGLKARPATADKVVVKFIADARVDEVAVPAGILLDAGQDAQGHALQYALDDALVANQGRWTDLRWTMPASDGSGALLSGIAFDEAQGLPWPASGARLFGADTSSASAARGAMAGSPLLAMSGGTRTIKLYFETEIAASQVSEAYASSPDAWVPLPLKTTGDGAVTEVEYALAPQAPPIAAPAGLDGLNDAMPFIKILYSGTDALPAITQIDVSIEGLTDVAYATDDGADKTGGRSYPFGNNAVVGSSFALASADWYGKKDIALTISVQPEWIDLPPMGFPKWYDGYPSKPADNNAFTVQTWLASAGSKTAVGGVQPLFGAGTDAPEAAAIDVDKLNAFAGQPSDSVDPRDWPQWLRFELTPKDFLSREYQQQVVSNADLNAPYTPQVASIAVGWNGTAKPAKTYQLTPFGYAESAAASDDAAPKLYLGFAGLKPGQDLSLYWDLRSPQALQLSWQYLNREGQWASMDAQVNDSTGALFHSGRWWAALPHDAADDGARMPSGRYWIRAAVADTPGIAISYPWLNGILTNAASATLQDVADIDASHFESALPADTITRTVVALDGITQVEQPWPSFGGRPAESDEAFEKRIAQRLLHRDRALTWNDIVMLLHEGFPEILTVQVPSYEQISILPPPRQQVVVVVPANGSADNDDALQPAFGAARLADMQAYLQSRASLWMEIVVRNAEYRNVKIDYEIEFTSGTNPDFGYRQLKQELIERYMPWSLALGAGAVLGNRIDYYSLVAWIQQRPYVSRVVSLTIDGETEPIQGGDTEVLILSLPDKSAASTLEAKSS